jgi:HEAT repeat protein
MAYNASQNGRARNAAAIFFGLSEDERSGELLTSLFADESVSVRSRALRMFAARIHPDCEKGNGWGIAEAAGTVPKGVKAILPLVGDKSVKVKLDAIRALSDYAALEDKDVRGALDLALRDPHHKIHHAAARALNRACPGCGAKA